MKYKMIDILTAKLKWMGWQFEKPYDEFFDSNLYILNDIFYNYLKNDKHELSEIENTVIGFASDLIKVILEDDDTYER